MFFRILICACIIHHVPPFLNAKGIELDQICKELLTLKNLIVTASAAATVEGIFLPAVTHMQQLDPIGTLC